MKFMLRLVSILVCSMSVLVLSTSCDDGGGGGSKKADVGDNDINTILCIGDSITDGECVPAGDPYPARLAARTKKKVVNAGACGEKSGGGASRLGGLLGRHKPGYVCILYGANDAIFGRSVESFIGNIQSMVDQCRANKSIPIIATLTPVYDGHRFAAGEVTAYSEAIRALAKDQKIRMADLLKEFGTNRDFIQPDGLHPSDSGTQLIALAFDDRI